MVGTIKTMCIHSVAVAIIVSVANAATVEDIVKEFREFGPKYVEYRKMQNEPAAKKEVFFQDLLKALKTYNWHSFELGFIEMEKFRGIKFFTEYKSIYMRDSFLCVENDLRGRDGLSLFKNPETSYADHGKLSEIEKFVTSNYASLLPYTKPDEVAYHCELFNGQDLDKINDTHARKEYMLIFLARATV